MVKRKTLANTGENDTNPENAVEASFTPGETTNPVGNENPGTVEGDDGAGETEQDQADREAAGIPDKPTRPAATPAAHANGSNAPKDVSPRMQWNAVKRTVMGLGAMHGAGKTSMIALAEVVTEAAQEGVITPDLVGEIYDKFREGVTAKSSYEDAGVVPDEAAMDRIGNTDQDKSREQQLSKLRQFIHLGNKYDTDALDLIRNARNMHIGLLRQALGSAEVKRGIKPGSTYSILVDVARAQLKKHKDAAEAVRKAGGKPTGLAPVMNDDELMTLMSQEVKDTAPMTGEEKLLAAYLTALAAEKGGKERNPVPSDELANAILWLRQALAVTAPDLLKEHEDGIAQAEQDKAAKEQAKAEREAEKARKAAEPKPPKESKADRQSRLATVAAEAAA
jgi:hypothetical protein